MSDNKSPFYDRKNLSHLGFHYLEREKCVKKISFNDEAITIPAPSKFASPKLKPKFESPKLKKSISLEEKYTIKENEPIIEEIKVPEKNDEIEDCDNPENTGIAKTKREFQKLGNAQYKAYVFTLNNYTEDEIIRIKNLHLEYEDNFRSYRYAFEKGVNTNTPHIQGFFECYTKIGYACFWKKIPRAWVRAARANGIDNWKYIGKGEQPKPEYKKLGKDGPNYGKNVKILAEGGDPSTIRQGERVDLDNIRDELLCGKTTCKIIRATVSVDYWAKYGRAFKDYEDDYLLSQKRTEMTTGTWLWGESGLKKSAAAFNLYPESTYDLSIKDFKKGWFDGYRGEKCIVIDELRPGDIDYKDLMNFADMHPYKISRRGREPAYIKPEHIIITSCMPPEECFPNRNKTDKIKQLFERYTVIKLNNDKTRTVESVRNKNRAIVTDNDRDELKNLIDDIRKFSSNDFELNEVSSKPCDFSKEKTKQIKGIDFDFQQKNLARSTQYGNSLRIEPTEFEQSEREYTASYEDVESEEIEYENEKFDEDIKFGTCLLNNGPNIKITRIDE